ncbi:MAG: DNA-binding protein, partial [Moorea sp. SIO4A3]|nr:DNA-binding protein [Moorena sp. SIO4A3]
TLPNIGDQVLIQGKPQFQSIPIAGQDLGELFIQELEQLQRQVYQPKSPLLPAPTDEQ